MSSPREQGWASVQILGVRVDCVDFQQTLDAVSGWIAQAHAEERAKSWEKTEHTGPFPDNRSEDEISGGQTRSPPLAPHSSQPTRQVCTVNPEFIMTARRHPAFAQVLAAADLCTPDGVGVLSAARLAGVRLNERVTGSDGIYHLCERAAAQGWRVFFLGAAPGVAERAATELARLYPGLSVAGTHAGSPADTDWPQIRQRLTAAHADLLFVAYGHPRQDIWIHQHREELPVAVALGIGGSFDFVAGISPRAPLGLRRLGLEWLYRLARQPWRWRRMAALPLFALLVLLQWPRRRPANE
ncbi:MAG: WecB/TagA/CpsF family glycosyltransferase [Caldilineaceae bacterium]|nr:WecB/TagA/CpsF family glycosyltransferase [Caldilineaceae bacterium]MDE0464491.1 WecB/TagA/CpsF family glycosyltransferase [Caldilineaceae bacterium]